MLACWPFAEPAWLGRLRSAWRQARQRSCERALHRALVHSLQGLGPGTLRDLGLADQVPPLPALPHSLLLMNYERSLW